MSSPTSRGVDTGLRVLLLLVVAAPALAVLRATDDGRTIAWLYREPKLVAVGVGMAVLATAVAWLRPALVAVEGLVEVLRRPALLALGAFLGWAWPMGLRARVRENCFYEVSQWLALVVLLVLLLSWARYDATVVRTVAVGLAGSLAAVTGLGFLQGAGALPGLVPIAHEAVTVHPSLMGSKNAAAHAVLGQLFVVGWLLTTARSTAGRCFWGLVLAAETVYLASLGSRTAWVAAVLGVLVLAILFFLTRQLSRRTLAAVLTAGALAAAVVAANPALRERAGRLAEIAANPRSYLDTDRGTYLLNTLNMVRHNPLGVGLGDWQTHYPVYRLHNRTVAFDDTMQVRRAHSDHVQMLGETGWPGFVLWVGWLLVVLRTCLRTRDGTRPLFLAAQWTAWIAAMATDYVVEMPYGKFQFILIAFLATVPVATVPEPRTDDGEAPAPPGRRWPDAVFVTCYALFAILYFAGLWQRVQLSAAITWHHQEAVRTLESQGRVEKQRLRHVLVLGARFDDTMIPGFVLGTTKTLHRDYLLLGHTAHLLGEEELARRLVRRSLELHPYAPNSLRLMARIAPEDEKEPWQRAYEHVLWEATAGYHP